MHKMEGDSSGTNTRTADGAAQPLALSAPTVNATLRHGEGIAGCCSVLSSVLRMQRSLTEVWSELSDDEHAEGRNSHAQGTYESMIANEDDETHDNRAAYHRFFVSVVDSTDKMDRLLAALDTPTRAADEHPRARSIVDEENTVYDCGSTDTTVQFNIKQEAVERVELAKTLRQLGDGLASDAGVIDLRAVTFWALAKRERLWAEDEKLTRAEQISHRSIRAMQVNHEQVDTVLGGRRKRIEDNMNQMQRGVEAQSKGWSEILLGVKDGVVRSRLHAQKRTRDIISATEERIAALNAELAESEHHVVGLNNESEDFLRAKNAYSRKAELLQHIVEQQRARLEQISADFQRTTREASSLDDSLQTISKLESAADGGLVDTLPSKEQNEGREKLQALVREESRRNREEQIQAITRRAGLLEENKRLWAEVEKAESVLSEMQTPAESKVTTSRQHQSEISNLRTQIKSATKALAQTERQLTNLSRKHGRTTYHSGSRPRVSEIEPHPAPTPSDTGEENSTPGRAGAPVDPQAWYQLEILRAQHGVLVEDLERCDEDAADGGADDEGLREKTLFTAACWQLRDNDGSSVAAAVPTAEEKARRDGDAALQLAAVAVAADLTDSSSGLARKIQDALEWEGQARPLEDKLVASASRIRWMYVLRLAVELGQCDQSRWKEVQPQLLAEHPTHLCLKGLYSTREDIHALLGTSSDDPLRGGVFSRLTEAKGEVTRLIEDGQSRLAKLNALLRILWDEPTGVAHIGPEERAGALNDLIGVVIGESDLRPPLALRLFSALGNDVVARARSGGEGVSHALARDIASLRLASKGVVDERSQRAAVAATELCAVLRITDGLAKRNDESLPEELVQRGEALRGDLWAQIKRYPRPDKLGQAADMLSAAEDFLEELPPEPSEHGPGNSHLDLMVYLLGVVTSGCQGPDDVFNPGATTDIICGKRSASPPSGEMAPAQDEISGAAKAVLPKDENDERQPPKRASDRRANNLEKTSGHQLDGKGTLNEILSTIASAMPSDPDRGLASVWKMAKARITRPRGTEEAETEAFELAVDAQVLEALNKSLRQAVETAARPGLSPALGELSPASVDQASAPEATGVTRFEVHAPLSGSEMDVGDQSKILHRQAEALRFKNVMGVVARTGLPLQSPGQADKATSLGAVMAASKLAKRWKLAASNDGAGLGRPELERLNSIMDKRVESLSVQLANLEQSKEAEKSMAKIRTTRAATEEVELSAESWANREVQRLNARIRAHREHLHCVEKALQNIRKGKGGANLLETLWMSPDEREEMEANLRLISRKIAKANFLLRTMRARWDLFKEKHRHLAPLVQHRLLQGHHDPGQSRDGTQRAVGGVTTPRSTLVLRERRPPSPVDMGCLFGGEEVGAANACQLTAPRMLP